jgi:DNA-binding beta-propeller fold protein YncE
MRKKFFVALSALILLTAQYSIAQESSPIKKSTEVSLPGVQGGIGFDDLVFCPALQKVLVPGGGSGRLFLIDPENHSIQTVNGFGIASFNGGHGDGVTSADSDGSYIFASDRTNKAVFIVDYKTLKTVGSAPLASVPDYVRYVSATNEVWVTEPDEDRIEVFSFNSGAPKLEGKGFIPVSGGPESLVIGSDGNAYTHLWNGETVAINVKSRVIVERSSNGCHGSRGIALDSQDGFVFAGCSEGKASVINLKNGKVLSSKTGADVDVIGYNPELRHLYIPSAKEGILTIFSVDHEGKLAQDGQVATKKGSRCATYDNKGGVWACDPRSGSLLFYRDSD